MSTGRSTIQLAEAVKDYAKAVRVADEEGRVPPKPFGEDNHVTVTDVAIAVDAMLRAVDMDIFEIQMWRSLGRS